MAKTNVEVNEVEVTGIPANVEEQEYDLLTGLLEAAGYKATVTAVDVKRNGKHMFTFHIHPISEKDTADARRKATSYMPNPGGKNLPPIEKDADISLYRSWKIFLATTDEDKQLIWGNKELKAKLNIVQSVETVDALLTAGEKDAICDLIDEISGFGSDNVSVEEFAKN